jgi:hypothetical protein
VFCWKGIRDIETGATQSFVLVEAEGIRVCEYSCVFLALCGSSSAIR